MPKIHCDLSCCEYAKRYGVGTFICGCDIVELVDGNCMSFGTHVAMSKEYKTPFWKRMRSVKDGHVCKHKSNAGKQYDIIGLTWFTDQDDRWGTDEIWFTEKKTGIRCIGKDIERKADVIKEIVSQTSDVKSLPEAKPFDL